MNYENLQQSIDKVIGKLGLQRTIALLDSFVGKMSIKPDETEKVKLITGYLVSTAIKCYDLNEQEFYSSKIREYREARMICYHLLRKYLEYSYPKIAKAFKQKERIVMHFYHRAEEFLSVPQFYKPFVQKYTAIENQLIEFIGKLE